MGLHDSRRQTGLCTCQDKLHGAFTEELPTLTERYGEAAASCKDQPAFCASLGGTPRVDMYCRASSCRHKGARMTKAQRSWHKEAKDQRLAWADACAKTSYWARHLVVLGVRKQLQGQQTGAFKRNKLRSNQRNAPLKCPAQSAVVQHETVRGGPLHGP